MSDQDTVPACEHGELQGDCEKCEASEKIVALESLVSELRGKQQEASIRWARDGSTIDDLHKQLADTREQVRRLTFENETLRANLELSQSNLNLKDIQCERIQKERDAAKQEIVDNLVVHGRQIEAIEASRANAWKANVALEARIAVGDRMAKALRDSAAGWNRMLCWCPDGFDRLEHANYCTAYNEILKLWREGRNS